MTWLTLGAVLLAAAGGWRYRCRQSRDVLRRRTDLYLAGVPGGRVGRGSRPSSAQNQSLPDALELLALVVGAGWPPGTAVARLAEVLDGELVAELESVVPAPGSHHLPGRVPRWIEPDTRVPHADRLRRAMASAPDGGPVLVGLLRAQAADLRTQTWRGLVHRGARRLAVEVVLVVLVQLPVAVLALFELLHSCLGASAV